jgi:hypothetical protein
MLLAALAAPSAAGQTHALTAEPAEGHGTSRPNVVVVVLDDMGFSDLGCYGGEVRTLNIDRLAESGLRFTRFYNASRLGVHRAELGERREHAVSLLEGGVVRGGLSHTIDRALADRSARGTR